jgi:hypothetical protein
MIQGSEVELNELRDEEDEETPKQREEDRPHTHSGHVDQAKRQADQPKKTAEENPTPENERLRKAALRKYLRNEIATLQGSLSFTKYDLEYHKKEMAEQKRQDACEHRDWWEKLVGESCTCGSRIFPCKDPRPRKRAILECPGCILLYCPKYKRRLDKAIREGDREE